VGKALSADWMRPSRWQNFTESAEVTSMLNGIDPHIKTTIAQP